MHPESGDLEREGGRKVNKCQDILIIKYPNKIEVASGSRQGELIVWLLWNFKLNI